MRINRNLSLVALSTLACLVTSAAPAKSDREHPAWMTGNWGEHEGPRGDLDCGDHTLLLHPAGYYNIVSTSGTWSYRHGQLCMRGLLEYDEGGNVYAPEKQTCQPVRRTAKGYEIRYEGTWHRNERCGGMDETASLGREVAAAERRRRREGR